MTPASNKGVQSRVTYIQAKNVDIGWFQLKKYYIQLGNYDIRISRSCWLNWEQLMTASIETKSPTNVIFEICAFELALKGSACM